MKGFQCLFLYRRKSPDFARVRIMTEEAPRMKDHRPAMVTDERGIGIIPSIAWEPDPYLVPVISHESLHIDLERRASVQASHMFDNLPLKPMSELFHRAGVYGWDLKMMSKNPRWGEMMGEA